MIKDAMQRYFKRLEDTYLAVGELPRFERDPNVADFIYQSEPDTYGYSTWKATEKSTHHDLHAIAPDLGLLHPSIQEYFNSWWFCALDGRFDNFGISLIPVLPGVELESFIASARAYKKAHSDSLPRVPIGVEFNGLQVLVDNSSGEVVIEDWERGAVTLIAMSLELLIDGMSL